MVDSRRSASLVADSVRSLALQGGPMSPAECEAFLALPHAQDALRLRIWDDHAKDRGQRPASQNRVLVEMSAAMRAVIDGQRV